MNGVAAPPAVPPQRAVEGGPPDPAPPDPAPTGPADHPVRAEPAGAALDVRRAVRTVGSRWLVVVLVVMLAMATSGALTLSAAPVYTSTAEAVVAVSKTESKPPYVLATGSQYILDRMTSYALLGVTPRVLGPVVSALRLDETAVTLAGRVTSQSRVDTAFIDVTVSYHDPATAARIADAVVRQLGDTIEELENGTVHVTTTGPAPVAVAPSNRKVLLNVALGAGGGLVLGLAVVLAVPARGAHRPRRTGGR